MPIDRLRYPCLRINKDNIMYSRGMGRPFDFVDRDHMAYWSNPPRTIVVDETGRALRLVRIASSRPSFNPLTYLAKSPSRSVRWETEDLGVIPLEELRKQIIDLVAANGWFTQSWENENQFRERIGRTSSYRELFEEANYYGKWKG